METPSQDQPTESRGIYSAHHSSFDEGNMDGTSITNGLLTFGQHPVLSKGRLLQGAILAVAMALAVGAYFSYRPAYQVTAWLVLPTEQEHIWAKIVEVAEGNTGIRANAYQQHGLLTISVTTPDPSGGQSLLDRVGEQISETVQASLAEQAASRPAFSSEYAELAQRLTGTEPASFRLMNPSLPFSAQLRRQWRGAWERIQADQNRIAAALAECDTRLSAMASERIVAKVDEQRRKAVESEDEELIAQLAEQSQLRQQLSATLLGLMSNAHTSVRNYLHALTDSSLVMTQEIQANHGEQTSKYLLAMQGELADEAASATSLSRLLDNSILALSDQATTHDLSALLGELGPAARQFVDRSSVAEDRLYQALESIKSSADYLPARLAVLYNKLARQMRDTLAVRSATSEAVRTVYLSQNVALAQQVNRIAQVTARIEMRRSIMRDKMLQEAQAELDNQHKAAIEQATAERDRLQHEWNERQQELLRLAEDALNEHVTDEARQELDNLSQLIEWHRRYGDDLAGLLTQHEAGERTADSHSRTVAVYYLPPQLTGTIRQVGRPWFWGILSGTVSMVLFLAIDILIAAWRNGRRHPTLSGSLTIADLEALALEHSEIPEMDELEQDAKHAHDSD